MLKKFYKWSSTWTGTFIIVFSIIFFIAQPFIIPSGSMKNSLLVGDFLFAKKFSYGIPLPKTPGVFGLPSLQLLPDFNNNGHLIEGDRPKRGDVVVFLYPNNDSIHYVKRAVATGGDIIMLKNKDLYLHPKEGDEYIKENYPKKNIVKFGTKLFVINPYKLKHPGIHNDPSVTKDGLQPIELFDMLPIQIPEGETFMMGDNRDHSNDSRFWGTVPYKFVVGKPWFIYFSWNKDLIIRWDRVFRTVESLENDMIGKDININHEKGIY